ncbi:carboxypeptidase-like regulatory domain-containing protein [Gaoshiqia sediminis]|uniref:Carboxypeptidase-like regulatory domain-containing protein n=1 Tax=Gaoshiqia sediminis TaxID=2986998 RepID=A0AA42C632_9BACT|nr:carboxypeptidase-like regulatory domain-containing protein [Gaoshiqia sediminis]MCW0483483.1 carboxypeptidase-like regulatory domain-containing protein [Gaoshiqia sediminis]
MGKSLQIAGFMLLWCLSFQVAAQEDEAFVLKKKISLHLHDQPVARVLEEISRQAGIDLSYDPAVIHTDQVISVDFDDQETCLALEEVLGTRYRFQVFGHQLIITLKDDGPPADGFPDTKSPGVQKISGVLTDARTRETIPFASISFLNRPFGTITNRDGAFELKIPEHYRHDTLVFSCLGYARVMALPDTLAPEAFNLAMQPVAIRLREIKVTAIDPIDILDKLADRIPENYPEESRLMTSFYREVLLQDKSYINVSEAIIQILKAPYGNLFRDDRIRFLKGRKSANVEPFKWVDFKMQGGPYYITKLDVVKTVDSFLDPNYRNFYRFEMDYAVNYVGRPTYVVLFRPEGKIDFPRYEGKLFIDQETYALVHAEFSLGKSGMKFARESLIRKKPKGFNVRPLDLDYQVTYKLHEGRWHLNTAQTSVRFRVRSRKDNINSVFHSISDLLVTSHEPTNIRRFLKDETFMPSDIFTEMIIDYDREFWGNFNTIQPNDDLKKAIKTMNQELEILQEGDLSPSQY